MIRVADIVMRYVAQMGIRDVFTVSGGGIMYLTDALGLEPRLKPRINNHEQAAAISAEAYARVTGKLGVCLVTTGPGSVNALSGLAGAYVDSIPIMCISGQVRRDVMADYTTQRQYGPQEIDIIPMVRPVTKAATTITEPEKIVSELDRAYVAAVSGRPGPVWINIPLDVQGALVDEQMLEGPAPSRLQSADPLAAQVAAVVDALLASERPLIIAGAGVRLAHAQEAFTALLRSTGIPALLTIGAMDLLAEDEPAYMGKFGPFGQRRGNFAVQNADLILSVGASMSIASLGFNTSDFAPRAKRKIMVNIDAGELAKKNYRPDMPILADAKDFLEALLPLSFERAVRPAQRWLDACMNWKRRYPIVADEQKVDPNFVSTYVFVQTLSALLGPDDLIVTGNSLDAVTVYQAFAVKPGQRVFTNVNYGAMGWDLPAAIGAACARPAQRTILVTGDGSIQFNLQELMTIAVNQLDITIFVINNAGYESIRSTQTNHFEGRFVGSDFGSGIGNPDFAHVAAAFGLRYARIATDTDVEQTLSHILAGRGPALVELNVSPVQARIPKVSSSRRADGTLESRPLHDMYPWLPAHEIAENMALFEPAPAAAS